MVSPEADSAHLDFGPLHHDESEGHRIRRNVPSARAHRGELASVLGQHPLEHDFRPLDHHRVILRQNRHIDLLFAEAVEHVRLRDGAQPFVINAAHQFLFPDEEGENLSLLAVVHFQPDVVEISGVPQGHEIALQGVFIVRVAHVSEHASSQR